MKRTLAVLALAVITAAGCRAVNPHQRSQGCAEPCSESCGDSCGESCGDACGDGSCEPCHVTNHNRAPRPTGLAQGMGGRMGRSGNLEANYPGGNGECFDRYCGNNCGPGYHPGPYDCSPCDSPNWGATGHRHPHGYTDGHKCMCQGQIPGHCPQPGPHCAVCGHGYCCDCCGPPAPGCECCSGHCGPSGDHNYNFAPGPPTGQTAYPYYTLRGPRDYLTGNPPSIGPY